MPFEAKPDTIIEFKFSKSERARVEKRIVSKLTTINIVKQICKNKNLTRFDKNSNITIINKESKKSAIVPTIKTFPLISKRPVDTLKGLCVATPFKFHPNVCRRIAIITFTINKA